MAEKKVRYDFTLKGPQLDFAREVDEATARELLNLALGGDATSSMPRPNVEAGARFAPPSSERGRTSLREYLDAHGAKRIPEKIVAVGEYLATTGVTDFSKDDLLTQFRLARESMPGNFRRDIAWTAANGWIAEDPQQPDRFYVTQSGKKAVEENFSDEIRKKSGFKSARRKRRTSR